MKNLKEDNLLDQIFFRQLKDLSRQLSSCLQIMLLQPGVWMEKILRSRKELGLRVFPIFYGVDPTDVRHQRGSFEEAFRKHDEKFTEDREKVQIWRNALKEVANISGWNSKNWHETRLIEEVTKAVWSTLEPVADPEIEVGIDSKIKEMDSLIMKSLNDVRIIGIWGMGGIGKTTLARAVYEKIHKDFDISCFLLSIRDVYEKDGLIHLQRKLLSHINCKRNTEIDDCYEGRKLIKSMLHNKKVLIILDDVSEIRQLDNLAGKKEWFGQGSRIIITTRDAHLLALHGVFEKYEIKILSNDESLQLFCQNAFKRDQPTEGYLELSRRVIEYASGLPLALKVLGLFLCGKTVCEWNDALDKLSKIPPNDIMKKLKVSYDGLEDAEKNIFLDIACFFKGMLKDWVIGILKNCGFYSTIGIKVLIEKSMVVDLGDSFWMHDLLQEMGKSIVFHESPPSRLWTLEGINHVLKRNKGTEVIQCIVLYLPQPSIVHWDPEAFSNMWNLRLLIISNLNFSRGIKCFPPALKVLQWVGYSQDALPQGVQLDELVDFNMQYSKIRQLWKETQQFLVKLKFINLSHCIDLIKTPNFVGIPNLERLVLEGCKSLVEVHHSLGQLKKLIIINLKDCTSLKTLPGKLEIDSLETIILSGCSKVRKLPEFGENMKCLSTLNLEETAIVKLPQSLAYLTSLASLNLRNCKKLLCLPNVLQNLKYIKSIDISGCSKFERFPDIWNENKALEELDVSGIAKKKVPSSIFHFKILSLSRCKGKTPHQLCNISFGGAFKLNKSSIPTGLILPPSLSSLPFLKRLNLSYCNINDGSLLKDISCLPSLEYLNLSGNNFVNLPIGFISSLLKLRYVNFCHCPRLQSLPKLPPNVLTINASNCASMELLLDTQQLWDLFASLNLQVSHINSPMQGYLDDIKLTLPGKEIPSWFHNQNYYFQREMDSYGIMSVVSFIVDVPDSYRSSKWLGIAVCLVVSNYAPSLEEHVINYYCSSEDHESLEGYGASRLINEQYDSVDQLHIFYIPCNFVCIKKLRLHFFLSRKQKLGVHKQKMPVNWEIKSCGWRLLCKEDIEAWHQTRCESYSNSFEFASQHLDGLNEVRITEDTQQSQCHHEITKEDGATFYGKHNQQDNENCNKCFKVSPADILSLYPFLVAYWDRFR